MVAKKKVEQTGNEGLEVITDVMLAEISVEASAASVSVLRRLAGLKVKGRCQERIDTVLVRRGLR
jgi:hypothetical protein